jgi:hypothetical protein
MRSKKTHKKVIERNILLIDLGLKTGLRRGELGGLIVRDIDLERNYLVVRQGKGMKDRIIDLALSLHQSLQPYLKGKSPDESVFGLSPSTISGIIRWAAKKAGVNIHTHSLRHFFGQSLVDTGTDLETVRRLMGHRNIQTTQVYLGRTDKQRRDAISRLDETDTTKPFEADKETDDAIVAPPTCFEKNEWGCCSNVGLRSDCGPCYYLRIGRTQDEIDRLIAQSESLPARVRQAKESFLARSKRNIDRTGTRA